LLQHHGNTFCPARNSEEEVATMIDAIRMFGLVVFLPAVIAGGLTWSLGRFGNGGKRRYSIALPVAIAFLAAYAFHPDQLPLVPDRDWQWLGYQALGTAMLAGLSAMREAQWWERALAMAPVMFVAAWQIVPTWETLQPTRPLMIPLVAAYLWLICLLSSLLPPRLRGRAMLFQLACVLLAVAGYVTVEVSLKIGLSLLPATAAAGGVWLASLWSFRKDDEQLALSVTALLPVFVVLAGGGAFVGAIELPEPRYLLLLIPASPLLLWLFAAGPLANLKGTKAVVAQTLAVAAIPVAVLAWTLLKPEPVDEYATSLFALPEHFAFFELHVSFFQLPVG
jgi:hypothetical protein